MQRYFDQEFLALKERLLEMGGAVEKSIEYATNGILQRKPEAFRQVHVLETRINQFHLEIDDRCLQLLAKQSPLASSLRFVLAAMKINADLERMGDQAANIAYSGDHLLSSGPIHIIPDLATMSAEVRSMVRESLDAFVRGDAELAQAVVLRDDVVDKMNHKIRLDLMAEMARDTATIPAAMDLIFVARNLERLADHATNIAEDVVFVASGEDIRHYQLRKSV